MKGNHPMYTRQVGAGAILALVVLLLSSRAALALPVTWSFSGNELVGMQRSFTGAVSFDSSAPNTSPHADTAFHPNAVIAFDLSIGGTHISAKSHSSALASDDRDIRAVVAPVEYRTGPYSDVEDSWNAFRILTNRFWDSHLTTGTATPSPIAR